MNFFRWMFSDEADVDSHPESQPLTNQNGNNTTTNNITTTTTTAITDPLSSLEQQQQSPLEQSQGASGNNNASSSLSSSSPPGLTDEGFQTWSQTFEAFHAGIFHTITYLCGGIIGYSFLLDTKWPIIDSMYFSVVLFTTVGYGDLHPDTHQGQIFTIFFALYGIIILGIFLGVIGDMVVERQRRHRKDTMDDCRRRYMAAFQHGTLQHGRHPPATPCTVSENIQAEEDDDRAGNPSCLQSLMNNYCSIIKDNTWSILILIATAIPVIVVEKWDAVKGVYWMVITATTIGLGDETPLQPASRALCIIYIPVAVYLTGRFVGLIASALVERRDHAAELNFMRRAFTLSDIERMDFNDDGVVSESEFLIYMLVTLQKVEQDDIDEIIKLFHKLDKTGDGVLTTDDLEESVKRTNKLTASSPQPASHESSWRDLLPERLR